MALEMRRVGFAPDLVDYRQALALQERLHEEVASGRRQNTVLLLEHPPVYTAGKRALPEEYPRDGTEVVRGVIPLWLSEARR